MLYTLPPTRATRPRHRPSMRRLSYPQNLFRPLLGNTNTPHRLSVFFDSSPTRPPAHTPPPPPHPGQQPTHAMTSDPSDRCFARCELERHRNREERGLRIGPRDPTSPLLLLGPSGRPVNVERGRRAWTTNICRTSPFASAVDLVTLLSSLLSLPVRQCRPCSESHLEYQPDVPKSKSDVREQGHRIVYNTRR